MSKCRRLRDRRDIGRAVGAVLRLHRLWQIADEMDSGFYAPSECYDGQQHARWRELKTVCRVHGYRHPRLLVRAVEQRMSASHRRHELAVAIIGMEPGEPLRTKIARRSRGWSPYD